LGLIRNQKTGGQLPETPPDGGRKRIGRNGKISPLFTLSASRGPWEHLQGPKKLKRNSIKNMKKPDIVVLTNPTRENSKKIRRQKRRKEAVKAIWTVRGWLDRRAFAEEAYTGHAEPRRPNVPRGGRQTSAPGPKGELSSLHEKNRKKAC